ncbi:hypothetical protein BKP45_00450 [Anaerobacillus alkalidiazotrophicus]|uniref:Core-binding (CB) domain-containing protein n=1 Tax=Anaerobacillus alkalidiazotrophicus TaxID=472963 RepID=A0A1S2M984_9BACI|nr:hypothetical protein BKP45_00450 [Anaerobacillus alkalidiazotrophicus]
MNKGKQVETMPWSINFNPPYYRYLGDVQVKEITTENLKHYLSDDGEKLKPASLYHRVRFIKSWFRCLMRRGGFQKIQLLS